PHPADRNRLGVQLVADCDSRALERLRPRLRMILPVARRAGARPAAHDGHSRSTEILGYARRALHDGDWLCFGVSITALHVRGLDHAEVVLTWRQVQGIEAARLRISRVA